MWQTSRKILTLNSFLSILHLQNKYHSPLAKISPPIPLLLSGEFVAPKLEFFAIVKQRETLNNSINGISEDAKLIAPALEQHFDRINLGSNDISFVCIRQVSTNTRAIVTKCLIKTITNNTPDYLLIFNIIASKKDDFY